ncbi:MAG TPA: hypothetical protein VFC58_08415 [Desulfosporosinus sp.]|nr:hypothetical protein [Desulfosporosinus sp.]
MNKRVLKTVSFIFFMSIVITGCSNSLEDQNNALKKEINEIKNVNAGLENTIKDLGSKLEEQEENNKGSVSTFESKTNIYPIFTANIDTYEKEVGGYVYIPKSIELKQKLIILANALSEGYFNNLPIEVVKIEDINNKKIAVINLNETKENQGIKEQIKLTGTSWVANYFQGSTGGKLTTVKLIETMLQREHTEQGIDGVRFLYNNGVCDFQHIPDLKNVNYLK